LQNSIILLTFPCSPSKTASTLPSSRLRIQPVTLCCSALQDVSDLKKTPCTKPLMKRCAITFISCDSDDRRNAKTCSFEPISVEQVFVVCTRRLKRFAWELSLVDWLVWRA
jgi:hypothetical protein